MRIGVDGRSLGGVADRGVAHYTRALLGALAAEFPGDELRVAVPAAGRLLHGAAAAVRVPRLEWLLGDVDVIWLPAPAPVALGRRTPLVLTVHDRSWERRPRDFTAYERLWHLAARPRGLARGARRVLCVSEAVRREVVAAWSLDPARVLATPLAPAAGARPPAAAARARAPYFLFVGALEPRKGPDLLAAAFRRARARGLRAELVAVGRGRLAPALAGEGIHRLGHVTDGELAALYAGALALVAPSRLEGFGLPPVEAAAHGVPAILSDLAPWRETLGDAARFTAPENAAALASAMLELERDDAARARLGAAARTRAGALSWRETARRTRAALAAAAGLGT